ncbi:MULTISPECIES: hypothetical protein [unclassified Cryobacterium]|uniref:hypothetical protein n=1 Tax=unclassified Cryobacterium TaxID=2649013 RepID=UPI001068D629|nr:MULTISPECIES: hypothetical protein [unclassified Cryobacterium]TFB96514.1 hypothetical protein E3O39_10605 [Cryobacterium sp. MDB2-A-1]TFC12799.1 hypothetical protein E3O35_07770 [Cryobacterium sp. MDB2-A-2]
MTTITIITKNVLKRAWTDLEPKLLAWLISGLTASILITGLDYVGVHISAGAAGAIVLIVGTIAGYIKASTTTVTATPGDHAA